ncbi:MAG: hypothetical protein EOO39_00510, partial [Cytophagaceae bacterium]
MAQLQTFTVSALGSLNTDADPRAMPQGRLPAIHGFLRRTPGNAGTATPDVPPIALTTLPVGFSVAATAPLPGGQLLILLRLQGEAGGRICVFTGVNLVTYYDDQNQTDKLDFPEKPFRVIINQETSPAIAYWTDNRNEPRMWAIGQAITSAFSLAQQPPVQWMDVHFSGLGTGTLATGHYRATPRYRMDSRVSSPFMLCPSIPIFAQPLYAEQPNEMGASGVLTDRAFSMTVSGIDHRWPLLDLLVTYSPDGETWSDLTLVDTVILQTGVDSVVLWCRSIAGTGESVAVASLNGYEQHILKSADMVLFNNKLIHGNIVQGTPPADTIVVGSPTLTVRNEYLPFEMLPSPNKVTIANADVNRAKRTPLAQTARGSLTLVNGRYIDKDNNGVVQSYAIQDERLDYSGTSYCVLRGDYRAGESYPIGVLWFDLLGQPAFVQPIGTFIVPALHDPAGTTALMRINPLDGTSSQIVHVGLRINDLLFDKAAMRGSDGKLLVSGFAIVRGEPSGKLGPQGIVLNTVSEVNGRGNTIAALPAWQNIFADVPSANTLLTEPLVKKPNENAFGRYIIHGRHLTFHSPDLLAQPTLLDSLPASAFMLAQGSVGTLKNDHQGVEMEAPGEGWHDYIIRANYFNAQGMRPSAKGRVHPGDKVQIRQSWPLQQAGEPELRENIDLLKKDLVYSSLSYPIIRHPYTNKTILGQAMVGAGKLLRVERDFLVDAGGSDAFPVGYMIGSIEQAVDVVPADAIRYQTTGHFQPVTEAIVATWPQATRNGKPC